MGSRNSDVSGHVCTNDCMYDRRRWDEQSLDRKATSCRRARIMGGRVGKAWSVQVCVLWCHRDAASSWISLDHSPSVCGVASSTSMGRPASRSRARAEDEEDALRSGMYAEPCCPALSPARPPAGWMVSLNRASGDDGEDGTKRERTGEKGKAAPHTGTAAAIFMGLFGSAFF